MRLVDADRLREYYSVTDPAGTFTYCDSILRCIDNEPTIHAIPVEWMKRVQRECVADIQQVPMYVAIGWLIDMWQKEQEAGLAQKLGIEPKEG